MVIVVPIQIINRHFVHTSACKREQTSKYTEEEDEEEKKQQIAPKQNRETYNV